jgi:hypothetical protein
MSSRALSSSGGGVRPDTPKRDSLAGTPAKVAAALSKLAEGTSAEWGKVGRRRRPGGRGRPLCVQRRRPSTAAADERGAAFTRARGPSEPRLRCNGPVGCRMHRARTACAAA